jgi:DNA polymerase IIIc chi subunit
MEKRIILFQIHTSAAKLSRLIETAAFHFKKRAPLLILAEDDKALQFVDDLLWKTPDASFLPHEIASSPTSALITLTKTKLNLNGARSLFNLCPTPYLTDAFSTLYDFEDLSSPAKQALSAIRFDAYKHTGWTISTLSEDTESRSI